MPQVCPQCGKLQPEGPRCLNCGYVYPVPVETSQGTRVTARQLVGYALFVIGFAALVLVVVIVLGTTLLSCGS